MYCAPPIARWPAAELPAWPGERIEEETVTTTPEVVPPTAVTSAATNGGHLASHFRR